VKKAKEAEKKVREEAWQKQVELAKAEGLGEPVKPDEPKEWPVKPDWEQSPLEVGRKSIVTNCESILTKYIGCALARRPQFDRVREEDL
jgi:hypothetical protein